MPVALLALNIVVWSGVLAYALGLFPVHRRAGPRKRPGWLALLLCVPAVLLSVVSYQAATRKQKQQRVLDYYQAGLDEITRGNLEEGRRRLEETLTLDPGHPAAKEKLAELDRSQKAPRREQERAVAVDPAVPTRGGGGGTPSAGAPTAPGADTPAPPLAAANAPPPAAANAPRPAGDNAPPPQPPKGTPGRKPDPLPHKQSPFGIVHYALEVDLDPPKHSLTATAHVRIQVRQRPGAEPIRELEFSFHPEFQPTSVTVDGVPCRYRHPNDLLGVTPPAPLAPGKLATVVVQYSRQGPAVLKDTVDQITPEGTFLRTETRWYPGTGELDFRAPVRVRVRVPRGYLAVSHGELRETREEGATTRFHWETTLPSAMICLAARKYVRAETSLPPRAGRAKPLPIYCYTYPEHRERAQAFLKESASIVRFYEGKWGPYPYEKLAVVEIPRFPGGYGPTSFVMLMDMFVGAPKLFRELLAHEIAHQWWGNSVAPRGLGAGWVSEAFAHYSAWLYDTAIQGNPRVLNRRVVQAGREYFAGLRRKGDQAIAQSDPYLPIGACQETIYEKGAVVLHMLRTELGDAAFFRALRTFADQYRHGEAKIEQFRTVVDTTAGRDLGWFFDQWLGRSGAMSLSYSFTTEMRGAQPEAVLTITQPEPAYRARMRVTLEAGSGVQTHPIELTQAVQTFRFPVKDTVSTVLVDPDNQCLMPPPRWVVPE